MKHKRTVFWFKRDLRIEDNTGLSRAVYDSKEIIPLYILDDQILKGYSTHKKRLSFFANALDNLEKRFKNLNSDLLVVRGQPEEILPKIIKTYGVDALYCNRAYGFYGVKRDQTVHNICESFGVEFKKFEDTFLVPPSSIDQRKVFMPFYQLWAGKQKGTESPAIIDIKSPTLQNAKSAKEHLGDISSGESSYWPIEFAHKRLSNFDFSNYDQTRDQPFIDGSSKLSPYLRFGVVSVRKVYNEATKKSSESGAFVQELAWREFWYHIMHYFPETRYMEFQKKRRNLSWINNEKWYRAWIEGLTGYPIVDAGMRQLKQEGWMHNRLRMIVASFLTKDLLCDWRWGDRHFAEHLIDYDEIVDIGNWQWTASCGADPKPLRILNPLLQSQNFDPDCTYIKKYIPELSSMEPEKIHNPLTYKLPYCEPIVNHYEMRNLAQQTYSGRRIDDKYLSDIKKDHVFTN